MWQVVGQDKAVRFLESSLKRGSLAHAYLLVGPAHVGKTTLALDLARAVNCIAPQAPCGQCPPCTRITSYKYSDVQIVGRLQDEKTGRFKRDISIDQMREVQKAAQLPPYEGKYKVFIIDSAEWLSLEAANCFLKTLEEPPAQVVFLLLAAKELEVLPTVVSRCQRVEMRPLPPTQVEAALVSRWGVELSQARLLAHLSEGCLGWALRARAEPQILRQRQDRLDYFWRLAQPGYESRFAFAAELAGQFEKDPEEVAQVLRLWGLWWRDLMMIKGSCSQWVVNINQVAELEESVAPAFSVTQINRAIQSLDAAVQQLRHNANPRLSLDVLMLSLPHIS